MDKLELNQKLITNNLLKNLDAEIAVLEHAKLLLANNQLSDCHSALIQSRAHLGEISNNLYATVAALAKEISLYVSENPNSNLVNNITSKSLKLAMLFYADLKNYSKEPPEEAFISIEAFDHIKLEQWFAIHQAFGLEKPILSVVE